MHFINVGDADATLIVAPTGETMLIDSGGPEDGGETVIAYLESQGVDRIDYLVATHARPEHVGGHAAIIEHYETERGGVGQAWDPGVPSDDQRYEEYRDAVEEYGVDLVETREGDERSLGAAGVTVFNPPDGSDRPDDLRYNSMALLVEFGDASFLFTGDAEADAESRMASRHGADLGADVYQVGDHGNQTSSTDRFLDAVEPRLAIVSSGYDSEGGHPHEETLERLAERDVDAYWTATHGTTVVSTDGSELVVATQHDAPTDPRDLRDGDEATADPTDPVEERQRSAAEVDPRRDGAGYLPGIVAGAFVSWRLLARARS